jgi:plastocyanin
MEVGIVRKAFVGAIAVLAVAGLMLAGVASATSQASKTVTLSGVYFNGKANSTLKAKVGDTIVFKWKDGVHNVVSTKLPAGVKKITSGAPKAGHAPFKVKLTKKGAYKFECQPHAALGMKITITAS